MLAAFLGHGIAPALTRNTSQASLTSLRFVPPLFSAKRSRPSDCHPTPSINRLIKPLHFPVHFPNCVTYSMTYHPLRLLLEIFFFAIFNLCASKIIESMSGENLILPVFATSSVRNRIHPAMRFCTTSIYAYINLLNLLICPTTR